MPIVVSPSTAVGTTLVLDGLDLASGNYKLFQFTAPIPAKRQEWIEGADADGAILPRDPLVSNGQAVAVVDMFAADKDAAHALIGAIVQKLEEADRNPTGIPLVWTASGASQSLTFYVLSGQVTDLPIDFKFDVANVPTVTVTMDCEPGGYGAEILAGTATVTGPLASVTVSGFPGDMPSRRSRLVVTEMSSQTRRHAEWGQEQRYYNPASPSPLMLDSDSLVTSGFAGTQGTLTGSYDPNATGNNAISAVSIPTVQAVCGTGTQPHIGTFRIKVRINSGAAGCNTYFRFAWRVGDGAYIINDGNTTLVSDTTQNFYELDLGLISIPEAGSGTQAWDGRVEAWSTNAAGETVWVDYIEVVPVAEGYGKARSVTATQSGVMVARDTFTGTTAGVALNGRTAVAGGTWATSGDTGDFLFSDALGGEQVTRTTTGDNVGRHAILGAGSYADVQISAMVTVTAISGATSGPFDGVVARFTNATNKLSAYIVASTTSTAYLNLEQATGTLIDAPTKPFPFALGATYRVWLAVYGSGLAVAQVLSAGGALLAETQFTTTALATGGTLATGGVGLWDAFQGTAATRYIDDIIVAQLTAEQPVLYSGRTLEIGSADTLRQNSGGTIYGRPPSYRGSRFMLQPAGDVGRTTRVWAKAHRTDVDTAPSVNIADQLKLDVFARPRWSVVPY